MVNTTLAHTAAVARFANIAALAHAAGHAAATALVPVPMQVVQRANPLDDTSPVVHAFAPVADGACGFAWIKFKGGTKWANYAKEFIGTMAGYPTGLQIWVGAYDQSHARKYAYAVAYAKVLRENGIEAYAEERMD